MVMVESHWSVTVCWYLLQRNAKVISGCLCRLQVYVSSACLLCVLVITNLILFVPCPHVHSNDIVALEEEEGGG